MSGRAQVAVLMGSQSDFPVAQEAFRVFDEFGVSYEARVLSAHRTPEDVAVYAAAAREAGIQVIICAAGMAAHLGGIVAAHTTLPVIGVPVPSEPFNGLDALLSMVQMPPGIPVATVTAGKAGGKNAALYAVSILALNSVELAGKLKEFRRAQSEQVRRSDSELQSRLKRE